MNYTPAHKLMMRTQAELSADLVAFTKAEGLEEGDAGEMLFALDLTPAQRGWLEALVEAWGCAEADAFNIATTYIAEGDYAGALPHMETASALMAGDPDFDALLASCRRKASN